MPDSPILVVGSANMDMVVSARSFPKPGETVLGRTFGMYPGGKGANQAVAAAKLGGEVDFLGKIGRDVLGDRLVTSMKREGVRLRHLLLDPSSPTGIALITLDARGQNEIVVVSGSNMKLTPGDAGSRRAAFSRARVLLLQLEIPLPTVKRAVAMARREGMTIILNPAPAQSLPRTLLRRIDYLTPNETEAETLSGVAVRDERSATRAARKLLDQGVKNVVVTLGRRGALLVNREVAELFPAQKVEAVDTTAAGDAFNGALACFLARGMNVGAAMRYAVGAASLSVTRMGAQCSMPTMNELTGFMTSQRKK